MKNASDATQVKEAKIKEKIGRDLELNDIRQLIATAHGKRVFWRYLELCGVYKSSFTGSSETFFLEGQRNIGLKILADIVDADPKAYVAMMEMHKGDKHGNNV